MKKIIKITTIMLVFAMLMPLALSSCIFENDPEEHDLIAEWKKDLADEDGVVNFTADAYCVNGMHNIQTKYPFRIEDEQIYSYYSDGTTFLYDTVIYAEDIDFEYHKGVLDRAKFMDDKNGSNIMKTLEKLKDHKNCYIIKTKDIEDNFSRILVYELEGAYYFLPLYENNVVWVVSYIEFDDNTCPFLSLFE